MDSRRVLDFDIENRPLAYLGPDYCTVDITAIAASWADEKKVYVWLLGVHSTEEILEGFKALYDEADVVTGHYIRNHDLPIINGALLEFGLPGLGPKLSCDTKNDLVKSKGVSKSQESLSDLLDIHESKYTMNQKKWRLANRLTPEGIEQTKKRVIDDVKQHKELRRMLIQANWLKPPKVWNP